MDSAKEYPSRLAAWRQKMQSYDRWHRRLGNVRLLFAAVVLLIGGFLCRSHVAVGWVFVVILGGLFLSGMFHNYVLRVRDWAGRAVGFYQSGMDRLRNQWAGKGSPGTEFLDPHHAYAVDLDLFGRGSVFELLNAAQTQTGRATLAHWLLHPASPDEIQARQMAVDELRSRLDLREALALLGEEVQAHIHSDVLVVWANQPRILESSAARLIAFCLPLITLGLCVTGMIGGNARLFLVAVTAQALLALVYQRRVRKVISLLNTPVRDLKWLSRLLRCLEQERFQTARLQQLQAGWQHEAVTASEGIKRLGQLVDWLDSRNNMLFAPICFFSLWGTQFAFAIEAWRGRFGPMIETWLHRLGEMEALSSIAGYAFEHPADPFPELIRASASLLVEGEGLGHPLIPESRCVRNDVLLEPNRRLLVISGSNMSGKSTWLRTLGVNLVLAMAGGPVRAHRLRLTPLQIGASIRTVDSLQEGISRFYAEITRLRQILQLTDDTPPLLFLLDELLSGTNSHDRRLGAASIVRSLVQRGAMGLITTHDLALTQIVDEVQPHGANLHFEDQIENGRMSFDYRLRTGVVEKSNALELMRSVGLEV
jgi:hypothetical protein